MEQKKRGLAALFQSRDMTEGSVLRNLVVFAIPLLMGNIAQLLYNTADAVIVGRYLGDEALSAIGTSTPLINFFIVLFMAVGGGVCIMVSQYFGGKEYNKLTITIGNSITLIIIVSILITAIATPLTPAMLRLLKTPDETFDMAATYLSIIFIGAVGNGFYNILSGILRGMGESLFPFFVLLGCVIANVFLDIWFVAGLNMGIGGAALATILAQIASSAVCITKILRMKGVVKVTRDSLKLRKDVVKQILKLGVPGGISMGIIYIGAIIIQSLVNSMGYLVAATVTATSRVDSFAILPSQTFGMSASTFTGQNIGAGKMDRVKKGVKTVLLLCLVCTVSMVTFMLLCGRNLIGLFTETEEVMNLGITFIRINALGYIVMVAGECLPGVMRGAGDSVAPMFISLIANVGLRVPLTFILVNATKTAEWPNGNPRMIYVALLCTLILSTILSVVYYKRGKWKTRGLVRHED